MKMAESPLKHLEVSVGACKAEFVSFAHTGIQHLHKAGEVYTHQVPYIETITPISTHLYAGLDGDATTSDELHEQFRSVLGSIAWTALTRPDMAVYIQALQRRLATSRIKDCKRCDLVIRRLRRHKCGLRSMRVSHPLRLCGFTDAAC